MNELWTGVLIGVGLAGLAGAVGVIALLAGRARLAAELAAAVAGRTAAESAAATAGAGLERARAEAETLRAKVSDLDRATAALEEKYHALQAAGAEAARVATRERDEALAAQRREFDAERAGLAREAKARDEAAAQREADLRAFVLQAEGKLREAFGAAAGEQLKAAGQQFLTLAQEKLAGTLKQGEAAMAQQRDKVEGLVKPIVETLTRTDEKLVAMQKEHAASGATLRQQVEQMTASNRQLQKETGQLVQALREPRIRGAYGEIQLKRVAELAGMREYCDFVEQDQTTDGEGRRLRPDMVINLPNQRQIVVDAKANIQPYLNALQAATPEAADACLEQFADGIARQAADLGKKAYWTNYDGSAEFVVMFVPGDQFVDAALARRPDLLDFAASHRVILASPSTLIALLRAVAVAFREQRLTQHAQELLDLGKQLHERAAVAVGHAEKLGDKLQQAVGHYNQFVGSYQTRLEPALERFEELGAASGKDRPKLEPVTVTVRALAAAAQAQSAPEEARP